MIKLIRLRKVIGPVVVYIVFFSLVFAMIFHPQQCAFERNLKSIELERLMQAEENGYLYQIEESAVDRDDPFCLAQIRGWIVRSDKEYYQPVPAQIVLSSPNETFLVKTYKQRRLDVPNLDQSDIESEALDVGFLARFPAENISKGEYKIGFLIEENGREKVLWTRKTVLV